MFTLSIHGAFLVVENKMLTAKQDKEKKLKQVKIHWSILDRVIANLIS